MTILVFRPHFSVCAGQPHVNRVPWIWAIRRVFPYLYIIGLCIWIQNLTLADPE